MAKDRVHYNFAFTPVLNFEEIQVGVSGHGQILSTPSNLATYSLADETEQTPEEKLTLDRTLNKIYTTEN